MGNKSSTEATLSRKLSENLSRARADESTKIKLLLLGAGESGKSTLFKQMRVLYGQGYADDERAKLRGFVVANLVDGALDICAAAPTVDVELSAGVLEAQKVLAEAEDRRVLTEAMADALQQLWADETFKGVWEQRSQFQLQDTWDKYADAVADFPTWGGPEWVPSIDDILYSRVRTTGVVDEQFNVKGVKIRMLDVGGQRNERRKWIHCFEGVTSVIFVASLSEYDQMLFEDQQQNRLVESVELFHEISNSQWFKESALVLFFNKTDLFLDKFSNRGVTLAQPALEQFDPPTDVDVTGAYMWFEKLFKSQVEDPNRHVFVHFTCATDTHQVDAVMKASSQHILRQNLVGSGVLV